jgi:hypothetical protein
MVWGSTTSFGRWFSALALIASTLGLGCGPKPARLAPSPEETTARPPSPTDLSTETGSHKVTLHWSIDRPRNLLLAGFNIYLSDYSLFDTSVEAIRARLKPYNPAPYPGDTDDDINRESITIERLMNGHTYFVSVRTVDARGIESMPSNEAEFTPYARGEFVISSDHDNVRGGFCFEIEQSVPARDPRSDLYLYASEDRIGLSSPYRLGAGLRKSVFSDGDAAPGKDDTIRISQGSLVTVNTRSGRAELKIVSISGQPPDISARISYVFNPKNLGGRK